MGYLFLVVLFLFIIAGETFLDNFWWIGVAVIIYLLYSIIRQIREVGENFDGGEFAIVFLKVAVIVGVICLMFLI